VPETKGDLPVLEFKGQAAWERWLEANQAEVGGAWIKLAKKSAPVTTINHTQALEGALCYGWIDGQAAGYDEHYHLVRFTPRRARSKWSQINREKAIELIDAGRMKPAGMAAVEAAKADGRWDAAYPPQSSAPVPDDFQKALSENPKAKEFFETLTGATRYAFLYRLHNITRPEARAKRIAYYIELLAEGKTLT
jgi:uncharacterized protein YdeI (YjbR/CyaY-like superfamily)